MRRRNQVRIPNEKEDGERRQRKMESKGAGGEQNSWQEGRTTVGGWKKGKRNICIGIIQVDEHRATQILTPLQKEIIKSGYVNTLSLPLFVNRELHLFLRVSADLARHERLWR
jgi:hypothetical protein